MTASVAEQRFEAVAHGDMPVLEELAQMHINTLANSGLDERTYHLVRLAALIAMDSAPASYLANLQIARDAGLTVEDAQAVCVAIAPIVGSARIVSATGNVLRGLGVSEALNE
jgi:alkylhydroperoxidase/carboxymuconolactone decarboxylase family protein YurZ